jgi:hypothetical protein
LRCRSFSNFARMLASILTASPAGPRILLSHITIVTYGAALMSTLAGRQVGVSQVSADRLASDRQPRWALLNVAHGHSFSNEALTILPQSEDIALGVA